MAEEGAACPEQADEPPGERVRPAKAVGDQREFDQDADPAGAAMVARALRERLLVAAGAEPAAVDAVQEPALQQVGRAELASKEQTDEEAELRYPGSGG